MRHDLLTEVFYDFLNHFIKGIFLVINLRSLNIFLISHFLIHQMDLNFYLQLFLLIHTNTRFFTLRKHIDLLLKFLKHLDIYLNILMLLNHLKLYMELNL